MTIRGSNISGFKCNYTLFYVNEGCIRKSLEGLENFRTWPGGGNMAEKCSEYEAFISIVNGVMRQKKPPLSRERLAVGIGRSIQTVNNFFTVESTLNTRALIADFLEIDKTMLQNKLGVASSVQGGYTVEEASGYEGSYLMIRPAFGLSDEICIFPLDLRWEPKQPALKVEGESEFGTVEVGFISLPKGYPYLSIHTAEAGRQSLIIVSTPTYDGLLLGMMLTLGFVSGTNYAPTVMPVVFKQEGKPIFDRKPQIIDVNDHEYAYYRQLLDRVTTENFAVVKV
jgi:hypothetical protein